MIFFGTLIAFIVWGVIGATICPKIEIRKCNKCLKECYGDIEHDLPEELRYLARQEFQYVIRSDNGLGKQSREIREPIIIAGSIYFLNYEYDKRIINKIFEKCIPPTFCFTNHKETVINKYLEHIGIGWRCIFRPFIIQYKE